MPLEGCVFAVASSAFRESSFLPHSATIGCKIFINRARSSVDFVKYIIEVAGRIHTRRKIPRGLGLLSIYTIEFISDTNFPAKIHKYTSGCRGTG